MLKPVYKVPSSDALAACQRLMRSFAVWLCDSSIKSADITKENCCPPRLPSAIEGDWLWEFLGKIEQQTPLLDRAKAIADLPVSDKNNLAVWVQHVSSVALHFQATPPVQPLPSSPPLGKVEWGHFKILMLAFYSKGFGDLGLPYLPNGTPTDQKENWLKRQIFVDEFRNLHRQDADTNGREVCVLCGGHLGKPHVDHWILESKFPLLSVCAENLLPICQDCNEAPQKGVQPVHTDGYFTDWFHPHFRHGCAALLLDYDLPSFSVTLNAKLTVDDNRVANLDGLLKLSERWTTEFKAEYRKQQKMLEQQRKAGKGPDDRKTLVRKLADYRDELVDSEPNYEIHKLLAEAMLDPVRVAIWAEELGI